MITHHAFARAKERRFPQEAVDVLRQAIRHGCNIVANNGISGRKIYFCRLGEDAYYYCVASEDGAIVTLLAEGMEINTEFGRAVLTRGKAIKKEKA